jgi:hypothetical protein
MPSASDQIQKPKGRPNLEPNANRLGDEIPTNTKNEIIAMDLMGIDPEALCVDDKGNYWMGEEYRPSILKFNQEGQLLRRYVPVGSLTPAEIQRIDRDYGQDLVLQVLPAIYSQRKMNQGFEGIACTGEKIIALMQGPAIWTFTA